MGAILGFLKLLYEHKEKIILAALIIASVGVGYMNWDEIKGGESKGNSSGNKPPSPPPPPPPEPQSFRVPKLGNDIPLEKQLALTDAKIFVVPEQGKEATGGAEEAQWPTIEIKSIFDPTKSGNFFAIIEANGTREFMREGGVFQDHYEVRRIDGIRNCLTIINRRAKGEASEKEYCK